MKHCIEKRIASVKRALTTEEHRVSQRNTQRDYEEGWKCYETLGSPAFRCH
jgi:hypothetical protein